MTEHHGAHEHAHEKKSFELTLPVAIVFAALVIAGAILITRTGGSVAPTVADAAPKDFAIREMSATDDHIIGSVDAPVVIIEYADFQCPYCSMIYPTLKRIVSESDGKVAWIFRNFPLESIHPNARPAAEAAECIAHELGNDAYWKFADAVFEDQQELGPDFYSKIAADLGADPTVFASCVSSKKYDARISEDTAEAVQNGGQGTPFSLVIGKKGAPVSFSGALPYSQINSIVQSVLGKQ